MSFHKKETEKKELVARPDVPFPAADGRPLGVSLRTVATLNASPQPVKRGCGLKSKKISGFKNLSRKWICNKEESALD